jgi:hypothetical protein
VDEGQRPSPPPDFHPTARTAVRRRAGRGSYDREAVFGILDEGLFGHVAFVDDGQPFAIPMLYARSGEELYLHGSPLSRLISGLVTGIPMCLTVTLVDGLVLARSAFNHSLNYRSVVVLGHGRTIDDPDGKRAAMETLVEHMMPGRTTEARAPDEQELGATEVIVLPIEEVSAKQRTGPPVDAAADYALDVWAGELPLGLRIGDPLPDSRSVPTVPAYVERWTRPPLG